MAAHSKLFPPELAAMKCQKILHPWTNSCFLAYLDLLKNSVIGSAGFLVLMYFFQYLLKVVKKTNQKPDRNFLLETIKNYFRTLFFCSQVASLSIAASCSIRKLLGRFYFYTLLWLPTTIGGIAIWPESPKNKALFAITWANLSLEVWIRQLEESKLLKWSASQKTFTFMILSAALSHLFHKDLPDQKYFWFFVPKKPKSNENPCAHEDTCQNHLFTHFLRYFTMGFGIQFLKIIFSLIGKPKALLWSLLDFKTYKLGAFLGFYVLIYQSIRCYLYQKQKGFSNNHDVIAGFLAGIAFHFQPSINIFNTAITTIIQILTRLACHKKILPKLPYNEIVFALSTGLLFHTGIATPHQCPKLMRYMMSAVTNNIYNRISHDYLKFIKECSKII